MHLDALVALANTRDITVTAPLHTRANVNDKTGSRRETFFNMNQEYDYGLLNPK